jgi:hypothetical protein
MCSKLVAEVSTAKSAYITRLPNADVQKDYISLVHMQTCGAGNEASVLLYRALSIRLWRSVYQEAACLMATGHCYTGTEEKYLRSEPLAYARLTLCDMATAGCIPGT